jgi:hypothetical protein
MIAYDFYNFVRTYAVAMNFLDFGWFLAGCAREKSPNCVGPIRNTRIMMGLGNRDSQPADCQS